VTVTKAPDIFLSYSREDQLTARRYAEALEREGFSVWWDQTLTAGETFDEVTEKALEGARAVVVLWSRHAVTSRWVRAEATQADENGTLVPVLIEPCTLPIKFKLTQTADLAKWKGESSDPSWQAFVAGLRRSAGREPVQSPSSEAPGLAPERRDRKRRPWVVFAAVAVLALSGVGAWFTFREQGARDPSIAVLPFANLSSDPEQEYFSDGLTEQILNELAQIPALEVTGRTSSFAFKGRNEDLRDIGSALGVANLLEGSVQRQEDSVRITAKLIDAATGANLWSRTYVRELKEVFALQGEVASDVAQALQVKLDVGPVRSAQGGTTDVAAYEEFLKAQDRARLEDFEGAMPHFRRAVELDPGFGLALYQLYILNNPLENSVPHRAAEIRAEREALARRVEALGVEAWWVDAVRQNQLRRARKWADSEAAGERALAAAPSTAWTLPVAQSILFGSIGRNTEAIALLRQGTEAEPMSRPVSGLLEQALRRSGLVSEADAERERRKSLPGNSTRDDAALDIQTLFAPGVLQQVSEGSPPVWREFYGELAGASGDRDAARSILRGQLESPSFQNGNIVTAIAGIAVVLDDSDLAMKALRRAHIDLEADWTPGIWAPVFMPLRADSRFKALLRDLGLVDYWRSSGKWGDFCKPVGTDDFECQ
jgi:TolB-like protein